MVKNSYKELKNSQYIVHYKMVQYKYSARLLNHDWRLLPTKSERFTGNLPVSSQDEVKPQTNWAGNYEFSLLIGDSIQVIWSTAQGTPKNLLS